MDASNTLPPSLSFLAKISYLGKDPVALEALQVFIHIVGLSADILHAVCIFPPLSLQFLTTAALLLFCSF